MAAAATSVFHGASRFGNGRAEVQKIVKACPSGGYRAPTSLAWRQGEITRRDWCGVLRGSNADIRRARDVTRIGNSVKMAISTAKGTKTEKKIAKLYVKKLRTVPLPTFLDASENPQHLNVFLREPEGKQCMLNTKTLRKYEDVGNGVFRCYLPTMEFLSFEVAPVLDLTVEADEESCVVDLLSCKFEGSAFVRGQNKRFAASLRNHLSWSEDADGEQSLHIRLELNVALEVYTLPFTMLPIAAVETPGTLILQALVDRLIPLFLDQLFGEFQAWAEARISSPDGQQIARAELQEPATLKPEQKVETPV